MSIAGSQESEEGRPGPYTETQTDRGALGTLGKGKTKETALKQTFMRN